MANSNLDNFKDQWPREKAMTVGVKALSDSELMAILFATGTREKNVLQLSADILDDNDGHLSKVAKMSVKEFCTRYKGIGPAKAISVLAALELGSRTARDAALISDPQITDSTTAYEIMRSRLERIPHEEFWVLLLNRSLRVIREVKIGQGGTAATSVDVKLIMRAALDCLADSMILCHNHPSGSLNASIQDDKITEKILKAATLFDIRVNDHLIITDTGYYSYRDHGKIL